MIHLHPYEILYAEQAYIIVTAHISDNIYPIIWRGQMLRIYSGAQLRQARVGTCLHIIFIKFYVKYAYRPNEMFIFSQFLTFFSKIGIKIVIQLDLSYTTIIINGENAGFYTIYPRASGGLEQTPCRDPLSDLLHIIWGQLRP